MIVVCHNCINPATDSGIVVPHPTEEQECVRCREVWPAEDLFHVEEKP